MKAILNLAPNHSTNNQLSSHRDSRPSNRTTTWRIKPALSTRRTSTKVTITLSSRNPAKIPTSPSTSPSNNQTAYSRLGCPRKRTYLTTYHSIHIYPSKTKGVTSQNQTIAIRAKMETRRAKLHIKTRMAPIIGSTIR